MILASILYFAGFTGVYIGEHLLGDGLGRIGATGIGALFLVASLLLRAQELRQSQDHRRGALRKVLIAEAVGISSLALYALSSPSVGAALGLDQDGIARWHGPIFALWPLLWLLGTVPMVTVDRLLQAHPKALPAGATASAVRQGLVVALSVSLLFPVNYLALQHDLSWDVALYRTTRLGDSTEAVARGLAEPVEVLLFYPAANEVKEEVLPYFTALEAASGGQLKVRVVDQALEPALAEEFKLRNNGQIVFRQGDRSEKMPLSEKMDRARRDLRKLDSLVQKHLLHLTKDAHTVYWVVGHEEASASDEEPLRKLYLFKKTVEALNLKVKNFGLTEGSAQAVPDDADAVILAAPRRELLAEELAALQAYVARGGHLLVLADTDATDLNALLAPLGVEAGDAPLANAKHHVTATRGPADATFLVTNRYGSHAVTKVLSRHSSEVSVYLPTVVPLREKPGSGAKVTVLLRGMPGTFSDADRDFVQGPAEPESADALGLASEWGEGGRAVVFGDAGALSDTVLRVSKGNGQLGLDAIRWLVGEEEIIGEIDSEEDQMIQHTRAEDMKWFYGTVFLVPLLVLGLGIGLSAVRRRGK
ncbi:MAG: Gldg family protein [Deltaproteobacteria bacterium]|nr:Gldg family protein [Deltaproteobacteria bacterium]